MAHANLKAAAKAGLVALGRQGLKLGFVSSMLAASFACTMDQPLRPEVQALTADDGSPLIDCFVDNDVDGWGGASAARASISDGCPVGTVTINWHGDCDDSDSGFLINPGRPEICGNLIDDDCDDTTDDDWCESPTIDPEDSTSECHDGVDNDDDGFEDNLDSGCGIRIDNCAPDDDGDSFGADNIAHVRFGECDDGEVDNNRDCDDDFEDIHPGATEDCNSVDDDCDGLIDEGVDCSLDLCYPDDDNDGYGDDQAAGIERTTCRTDEADNDSDCDDNDSSIHSGCGSTSPDSGTVEFCWNGSGIDDVDMQRMQLVMFEEGSDRSAESVVQTSGLATTNDCIETTQVFAVGDVACVNVTFTHNDPGVPVYNGDEWFLAACDGHPCDPIVMGIPSINGQRPALNEVYTDEYRSSGSRLSYTTVSEDSTPTAGQWFWATNWNGTGVDLCVTMTDVLF